MRYLWIVRKWGTHLLMLGVHERINHEARVTLDLALQGDAEAEIYLASACEGVQSVNPEQARAACQSLNYTVDAQANRVLWRGKPLAEMRVVRHMSQDQKGRRDATVRYTWCAGNRHEHAHRVALLAIAQAESVQQWESAFAQASQVHLDGRCLYDMCTAGRDSAQRHAQIVAVSQGAVPTSAANAARAATAAAANDANAEFAGFAGSGAAHLSRLAHGQ